MTAGQKICLALVLFLFAATLALYFSPYSRFHVIPEALMIPFAIRLLAGFSIMYAVYAGFAVLGGMIASYLDYHLRLLELDRYPSLDLAFLIICAAYIGGLASLLLSKRGAGSARE